MIACLNIWLKKHCQLFISLMFVMHIYAKKMCCFFVIEHLFIGSQKKDMIFQLTSDFDLFSLFLKVTLISTPISLYLSQYIHCIVCSLIYDWCFCLCNQVLWAQNDKKVPSFATWNQSSDSLWSRNSGKT